MISILSMAMATYGILLVYVYFSQSSLVYFPLKNIRVTPLQAGMEYKEVNFASKDGKKLNGWFIPADGPKGVLLFCHGNAGNISHRMESIRIFHEIGLSVFIFDYRGYGKSEGIASENGTYLDAEAAWEYLIIQKHYDASQITVFGRSIGASIAAKIAAAKNPRALIVESSFTSITDLGAQLYPFLPVRLLSRFRYDTLKYIKEVRSPVLVIHSSEDEIIPFSHGEAIFKAANPPKEFLEIQGSHNEGFWLSRTVYSKAIEKFIGN